MGLELLPGSIYGDESALGTVMIDALTRSQLADSSREQRGSGETERCLGSEDGERAEKLLRVEADSTPAHAGATIWRSRNPNFPSGAHRLRPTSRVDIRASGFLST